MLLSGFVLSTWTMIKVATEITRKAASNVMKIAYSPRLRTMSWTSARRFSPRRSRATRTSRLSRARRSSAVARRKPRLGSEPRRSSQPRWRTKYSLRGCDPSRLIAKSNRNTTQIRLSKTDRAVERRLAQGQQEQDHDREREDRQDEDEDVVRVAVTARPVRRRRGVRCLLAGHRPLHVASPDRVIMPPSSRSSGAWTPSEDSASGGPALTNGGPLVRPARRALPVCRTGPSTDRLMPAQPNATHLQPERPAVRSG